MCCCYKDREYTEESVKDGALLQDRHCTDICCILIFFIFLCIWMVILAIAVVNGDPRRMLLPSNFRGDLCGDMNSPLEKIPNLFIPLPNRYDYGICVEKCPAVFDFVCNNDVEGKIGDENDKAMNVFYNHNKAEFDEGQALVSKCANSCSAAEQAKAKRFAGLLIKLKEYKCFPAFYKTSPTIHRCLPIDLDLNNLSLLQAANEPLSTLKEAADLLGIGTFFVRGFGELQQCWVSIAICCATACVVSLIWIMLLRWILAPIVYSAIVFIFMVFIIIGVLALLQANNLESVQLPGEKGTGDQVKFWRAVQYISFIGAGIYVVLVLVFLKRIRIAIILMEESSKAFQANPILVVLPPIVIVVLCGFVAVFIVTAVYIQTIGSLNRGVVRGAAVSVFGERAVNASQVAAAAGQEFANKYNVTAPDAPVNVSTWNTSSGVKALHAYNFFGFLWVANICIFFAFFIMALVVSTWYYSATGVEIDQYENGNEEVGRLKSTAPGTFCKAIVVTICNHLGSIFFGALLIAIIQFIRAVVLYIEKEYLDRWKNNATVKILLYVLNCVLACIERIVRVISRSAFVIICIKNTSFCPSAFEAMAVLLLNFARVGALQVLSTASCFLLKIFIVGSNCLIGFALIQFETINGGKEVESGLFPMIAIFFFTFAIASVFVNVFEACVDTIMICFFIDESTFQGKFLPPNLAKLLDQFKHIEEARRKYDEQLTKAGTDEPAK